MKARDFHCKMCKGGSSDRRKIIPDGNLDLHKGMRNARNDTYIGKCKRHLSDFSIPLEDFTV